MYFYYVFVPIPIVWPKLCLHMKFLSISVCKNISIDFLPWSLIYSMSWILLDVLSYIKQDFNNVSDTLLSTVHAVSHRLNLPESSSRNTLIGNEVGTGDGGIIVIFWSIWHVMLCTVIYRSCCITLIKPTCIILREHSDWHWGGDWRWRYHCYILIHMERNIV